MYAPSGLAHASSINSMGSGTMGGAVQQPRKEAKLSVVFNHTNQDLVRPGGTVEARTHRKGPRSSAGGNDPVAVCAPTPRQRGCTTPPCAARPNRAPAAPLTALRLCRVDRGGGEPAVHGVAGLDRAQVRRGRGAACAPLPRAQVASMKRGAIRPPPPPPGARPPRAPSRPRPRPRARPG
jgi:hypothetical protein